MVLCCMLYILQGVAERKSLVLKKMAQIIALAFVIDYPHRVSVYCKMLYLSYNESHLISSFCKNVLSGPTVL